MIKADDLRALVASEFELRCGAMRLCPTGASPGDASSGAGYLRQTPTGELALVMFIAAQPPPRRILWETNRKSGELLAGEDYYCLDAIDFAGRAWTATRVRPHFTQFQGGPEPLWMAEATLRELRGAENLRGTRAGSSLRLWYRGEIEFPFQTVLRQVETAGERMLSESLSIAAAEFSAVGCEFFVRHESGYLVVQASTQDERLAPELERRVHEALEFLLARRLAWAAVERREGAERAWRLSGAPLNDTRGRMQLPVAFTPAIRDECEPALELFRRFLERIHLHRGEGLPDLSVAMKSALEGSRSPLDAHALDIAVAVEAVLGAEFADLGEASASFRSDLVQVGEAIEALAISDETKLRLRGRISSMSAASAKSRLLALANRGDIAMAEVRAWETIRHRGAHGAFISGVDQDYVNAFWGLVMLLYRLIFAAVGYQGPYRDYGQLGWPWRGRDE